MGLLRFVENVNEWFCDMFSDCCDDIFPMIFGVLFAGSWSSMVTYFLYLVCKSIDETTHVAPTNCTVLDTQMTSDGWALHVNYSIPEDHNAYRVALLQGTNANAIYTVNQTLSCFYSTHEFDYVVESPQGVIGGTIFGLLVLSVMAIPVAIAAFIILLSILYQLTNLMYCVYHPLKEISTKLMLAITSVWTKKTSSEDECNPSAPKTAFWTAAKSYVMVRVAICKETFGSMVVWFKTRKSGSSEAYDLEDQRSQNSDASSKDSYCSTKELLSIAKHHQQQDDQSSIGSSTL